MDAHLFKTNYEIHIDFRGKRGEMAIYMLTTPPACFFSHSDCQGQPSLAQHGTLE